MAPKRAAAAAEEPPAKRAKAEPKAKGRAKAAAKAAARASDAELEKELKTMIQAAKDGEFEKVFELLDKYPPYVNERPEERMFSAIHQACYWGDLPSVQALVEKYKADVFAPTKDGKSPAEVAEEHGHPNVVKYLKNQEKKKAPKEEAPASGSTDRNRIKATRNDGEEEADMNLDGVNKITLRLGADGGAILCGAALVYGGEAHKHSVCYTSRKFGDGAVQHSGDSKDENGRSLHVIEMDMKKMPKNIDKVYLTLCSCGADNLSKFKKPSVELLGDGEQMIRYDLADAGKAKSTVMAVIEKTSNKWGVSPVGSITSKSFCGNYNAAKQCISDGSEEVGAKKAAPKRAAAKKGGAGGGDKSIAGKNIVFTGTLSQTRKNMTAKAEEAGATVQKDITYVTHIVVAGPDATANTKVCKAASRGVPIWTEEEFNKAL
mmetsp:Transcript_40703/g.93569  ORF Transcript_40703/g.93569 Transcript_40703/m.93569 type:complete len:433 (-) Transcript_40703:51-1349(-)